MFKLLREALYKDVTRELHRLSEENCDLDARLQKLEVKMYVKEIKKPKKKS